MLINLDMLFISSNIILSVASAKDVQVALAKNEPNSAAQKENATISAFHAVVKVPVPSNKREKEGLYETKVNFFEISDDFINAWRTKAAGVFMDKFFEIPDDSINKCRMKTKTVGVVMDKWAACTVTFDEATLGDLKFDASGSPPKSSHGDIQFFLDCYGSLCGIPAKGIYAGKMLKGLFDMGTRSPGRIAIKPPIKELCELLPNNFFLKIGKLAEADAIAKLVGGTDDIGEFNGEFNTAMKFDPAQGPITLSWCFKDEMEDIVLDPSYHQ